MESVGTAHVAFCGKRDTARAPSNRLISADVGQANGPLHRPLKPARDRLEERRDDQQAILTTSPGRAVDSLEYVARPGDRRRASRRSAFVPPERALVL